VFRWTPPQWLWITPKEPDDGRDLPDHWIASSTLPIPKGCLASSQYPCGVPLGKSEFEATPQEVMPQG